MVEELLKILPPYLVYRFVIETVGNSLAKIGRGPQKQRVERSKMKELWAVFYDLAQQRIEIVKEAEAVRGKQIVCDNAKVSGLHVVRGSLTKPVVSLPVSEDGVERRSTAMRWMFVNALLLEGQKSLVTLESLFKCLKFSRNAKRSRGRKVITRRCAN